MIWYNSKKFEELMPMFTTIDEFKRSIATKQMKVECTEDLRPGDMVCYYDTEEAYMIMHVLSDEDLIVIPYEEGSLH